MRRILMSIGLLLLIGLAMLGFKFLKTDNLIELDGTRPEQTGSKEVPDLKGHLQVSLPVSISFEELARLVNLAPVTQSGEIFDPVKTDSVVEDRLEWVIRRNDISVYPNGDTLGMAAGLQGKADISGDLRIPGNIGSVLGALNVKGVPISQTVGVQADVWVLARPEVRENWTIAPNLDAHVEVGRADLPIAKLGSIDLRPVLQPVLDRAVGASLDQLQARFDDPSLLQGALAPIWRDLCKAFPVNVGEGAAWVVLAPLGVGAASPVISDTGVTLAASVEADVSLVASQSAPDIGVCAPFPDKLTVFSATDPGQTDIRLPVIVDWSWLETQLSAMLSDPIVEDFGTLTLRAPSVFAFGDALLIGVDLDLQSAKTLVPDVRGQIWLRAAPVLDKSANQFRLENVALTTESATALGSVASWTADRVLSAFLDRQISIDLFDLEERVIAQANAQVAGLTAALNGAASIKADLRAFKIDQFVVAQDGLAVLLEAEGSLGVEDLKLEFLR